MLIQITLLKLHWTVSKNEELRDPKVCYKFIKDAMKDSKYYLLLDEVQFMPRFEEVLNSLLRMSNIDVCYWK